MQAVLLAGFLNFEELEAEVFAQNPDLEDEQKEIIQDCLERFKHFVRDTEMTQSIVSELSLSKRQQVIFSAGVDFKRKKFIVHQSTKQTEESIEESAEMTFSQRLLIVTEPSPTITSNSDVIVSLVSDGTGPDKNWL